MSDENMAAYRQLHADLQVLLQSRGTFLQQKTENELVKKELSIDGDEAICFKLVGPLLLRQDIDVVNENVEKRLEFINGEIEKVERNVASKQEEQKELAIKIRGEQQDMRSKAADAARKAYQEASGAATT